MVVLFKALTNDAWLPLMCCYYGTEVPKLSVCLYVLRCGAVVLNHIRLLPCTFIINPLLQLPCSS